MNEETMKAMNALAGGTAPAEVSGGETTDWKAKYEAAQRELASAKVEQGRVKKLDEEKKELERQLAEARSAKSVQSAIDALPEDLRADTPEDYQRLTAFMSQQAAEKAVREYETRRQAEFDDLKRGIAERDARESEETRARFGARIEYEFPGFLRTAVAEGGDKHGAWVQYQRFNAASINAATQACDFDTLSWHIRNFYVNELGIAAPSGGSGAAAPDPSTIGGGTSVPFSPGRTYTWDEVDKVYDEIERLRSRGDKAGMKRLSDEIENAQREGRVK